MSAPLASSSTADAIADIQRVVEKKRSEADKMRYDLNESLKELYELQSQVMALERENEIVGKQLQRAPVGGLAIPARTNQSSPDHTRPQRDESGGLVSTIAAAIYATDEIRAKSEDLAQIKAETQAAEFRGKMFRHMKDRLAAQVVNAKRDCSKLQESLHESRAANQELHRKELEVGRQLQMAKTRLAETKKHVDTQNTSLKRELQEQRTSLQHKEQSNAFLDAQITAAKGSSSTATLPRPPLPFQMGGAIIEEVDEGVEPVDGVLATKRMRDSAGIFTARGINLRLNQTIGTMQSEEMVFVNALRQLGLPVPRSFLPAEDVTQSGGAARQHNTPQPSPPGSVASQQPGGPAELDDVNFLVRICAQQDEVRISLLHKQAAEEARISALQAQLQQLRGVGNGGADSISQALATAVAKNIAAMHDEAVHGDSGSVTGGALHFGGTPARRRSLLMPLYEEEPDEPSPSTGNRAIVKRETRLADANKRLFQALSENEYLLAAVMPVRIALAAMAHKLLGIDASMADPEEARFVMQRLVHKCAAMVEDIRKVVALADPDGSGEDWSTLQAQELSSAIAAATDKTAAAGTTDDAAAGNQRFLSPYNTRVGTSHGVTGGGSRAGGGGSGALGDDSAAHGEQLEDEEEGGGGLLSGTAAADADDDQEVLDRAKLKKMSEKMMRFRTRMSAQLPGMIGGPGSSGGSGGGTKLGLPLQGGAAGSSSTSRR